MDRLAKKDCVDRLRKNVCQSSCMLVVTHSGLNAKSISGFRRKVRDVGGTFEVVKNTLAKKALGEDVEFLNAFRFPTAVLLSKDPVSLSKVSVDFAKEQKERFRIVLGRLDGVFLSEKEILELSSLPSLGELRAKVLCLFNAVAGKFLSVLQAPSKGMLTVLDSHQKKNID
ncbi:MULTISPECIES: 50S ribosomal protein L10 [Holospora]|uniref:Large ribosomal subunit protein uL10 n=2 Tax=Holospora TaxID=44747 RepID=A0A061JFZ6_9PROT|nr:MULTISPECIES: 50S ribosomal protein L10 [Holospora]ETZ04680.1 50S ribosomal protein L10 [Holospora undulata HU1]GAJ46239.1 50S ribosomal protein L10 [Holospora elegans E1]